ncbi:ABC transporter substrate-binding protein [Brevibacillus sp. NRS-1366]|uniref:ABC transporter substrate-binding protein n=1 Tax=Brevibacillus sp. NRS-1366 TaxID=3233899 RepID=UPI003D25F3BC
MLKKYFVPWLLLILCITACTPNTAGTPTTSGTGNTASTGKEASQPVQTDLVVGLEADAATMLANTQQNYVTDVQIRNIYDALIDRDAKGELVPGLATEWKNVNDLTWELTLQDGVTFHNGAPFTADDVKFSIEYILDEKNKSFYRTRWKDVKEVKVIDPHKVQIVTTQPFPTILQRMADDILIMSAAYVAEVGIEKAASQPIGTGAYTFVKWSRDESLQLAANEAYWRGAPAIKKLTFRYIPEFSTRLSALLSGEVHLIKNIPVDSVDSVKNTPSTKVETVESARINFIILNSMYNGPLKDQKVRQAISYAVDIDGILNAVLNGYGKRMTGPLPDFNLEYVKTEGYAYDPDKAVQLLKEAGYEPSSLELQLDTPSGRYPMDSHVAQAIASQLQKIGIKVNVQVNEWGTHVNKLLQKEMKDMYLLGSGPVFEAQGTMVNYFTKDSPFSGYTDADMDKTILELAATVDPGKRQEAFAYLQKRVVEEAAWIPLWQQRDIYGVSDKLDFQPRADEKLVVSQMKWLP